MNRKLPAHHLIINLCAASWLVATSGALAQDNLTSTIARAEQILLGSSQDTGTVEERLSAVEQKLYGKPRKGPLLKRMQAVAEMLRITPAPSPGPNADGADVSHTANKSAADSSVTGNSVPTAAESPMATESPTTQSTPASSEPSRWDKPGTPPTSASYFPYKAESASQAESRQNDQANAVEPVQAAPAQQSAPLKKTNVATKTTAKPAASPHTAKSANHDIGKAALVELKPQAAKMDMPPLAPSIHKGSPNTISSARTPDSAPVTSRQDVAKNLLRQGLKLHAQGQTGQAERLFRRVLTIDPRNADAFFNLGSIAEARDDLISALTNYRAALNLKPSEHDFQTAVTAVEKELNEKSNESVGTGEPASERFSAPSLAPQPAIAGTGTDIAGSGPAIGGTDIDGTNTAIAGSGTAIAGSGTTMVPFQLKSTQFDSLLNVQTPTDPLMNVSSPLPTPTLNVSSNPPVVHKTKPINAIFSVGVGLVLQGSGLHCPICRIMSGLK